MPPVRYLEFDSTYRDRTCYPCPADFTVPVTCATPTDGLTAKDYAAAGYPSETWYQVPYAGSDATRTFNPRSQFADGSPIYGDIITIPRFINARLAEALWPIDWEYGTSDAYRSSWADDQENSPREVPGTGVGGTLVSVGEDGARYGDPLFWRDLAHRSLNVTSPGRFSGGTAESPALGAAPCSLVPLSGYLVGATLLKFNNRDPVKEDFSGESDSVPMGSLGFPFYYRRIVFRTIEGGGPRIGMLAYVDVADGPVGIVAAIPTSSLIILRLGGKRPIEDREYPPFPPPPAFSDQVLTLVAGTEETKVSLSETGSGLYTGVFAGYYFTGQLESATITSYSSETGVVGLSTPFSQLSVTNDTWLIDFGTNPTGLRGSTPRIFFPNGRAIPNYYTGAYVQDASGEALGLYTELVETQVESYDFNRKILGLSAPLAGPELRFSGGSTPAENPVARRAAMSLYTVMVVSDPLPAEIPSGSLVSFGQGRFYGVAQGSDRGFEAIVLRGPFSPDEELSVLRVPIGTPAEAICPPPWEREAYEYWKVPGRAQQVVSGKLSLSGIYGGYTVATEGQTLDSEWRLFEGRLGQTNPRRPLIENVPYPPLLAWSVPGAGGQFAIRPGALFRLSVFEKGSGYAPTDPALPAMVLAAEPREFIPPFAGMLPLPEQVDGIYSWLNICFVDIVACDAEGGILELAVNCPGGSPDPRYAYKEGETVTIVSGTRRRDGSWGRTHGLGCRAIVTSVLQSIAVPTQGGLLGPQPIGLSGQTCSNPPVQVESFSSARPGDGVYLPQYGLGLGAGTTPQNSAPRFASFRYRYGTIGTSISGFVVTPSEFPAEICPGTSSARETGWRVVEEVVHAANSQDITGSGSELELSADPRTVLASRRAPAALTSSQTTRLVFLGIRGGYDLGSFAGKYSLTGLAYLDPALAWSGEPSPGTYSGPVRVPDPIRFPVPHTASLNGVRLLRFTADAAQPMNYTGTWVSQNQAVCHEIELVSLVLPNLPLSNPIGGLIAFYPYVYVGLYNATSPVSAASGVLYSNNPHAAQALFRCAITNTPTPDVSRFIKISGNGAVQTVKFKPNDSLRFRVFLQDGQNFVTTQGDRGPPAAPEPTVQISAQFAIRRLV